jgi:hypothetical protein
MAGDKYITNAAGTLAEKASVQTSAGAGDAGKIPALDSSGRLATNMMPTGIGPDTAAVTASEALAAGDFVNIWSSGGSFRARKADGSASGKEAHGFVLAAVSNGATATVYSAGRNTQVTGATPGVQFLSATTPGGFTATAPSGSGQVVQRLGVAVSATEIVFEPAAPIVLV